MKEFVKDSWYKVDTGNNTLFYFRFDYIIDCKTYNEIHYTERIIVKDDKFYKRVLNDYISNNAMEKYALNNPVSLSEISKYIPTMSIQQKQQLLNLIKEI